jgi:beta-lactamase class A
MLNSRRNLLAAAAAGSLLRLPTLTAQSVGNSSASNLQSEIQQAFAALPDRKSFKIWAPPAGNAPGFMAELNATDRRFSASANKAYILCERMRQLDSPHIEEKLATNSLKLDNSVWSLGSDIFNPPDLSGTVSERTAMEAMVIHSDNTATDMVLNQATAKSVRAFLTEIGATATLIPDSTRALGAYLFGASNYLTITWDQYIDLAQKGTLVHPFLNDVETFASSASDLISFYSRALQGEFFKSQETLQEFRRILSLGDINHLVPFPIGMSVFGKAGYTDIPGSHARCIAGGMYFAGRWVYLAAILNWDEPDGTDPKTERAFFRAIRTAIDLVQNALTGGRLR